MSYAVVGFGLASSDLRQTSDVTACRVSGQMRCRARAGKLRRSFSLRRSGTPRVASKLPSWWRGTVIMARLSTQTPASRDYPAAHAAHAADRRREIVNGAVGMHPLRRTVRGNPLRPGKISRAKRDFFRYPGPRLQARIHPSSQLPGVAVMSGKVAEALSGVTVPNDCLELDCRCSSATGGGR